MTGFLGYRRFYMIILPSLPSYMDPYSPTSMIMEHTSGRVSVPPAPIHLGSSKIGIQLHFPYFNHEKKQPYMQVLIIQPFLGCYGFGVHKKIPTDLPDVPPSTHQPPPECRDFLLLHDSLPLMPHQVWRSRKWWSGRCDREILMFFFWMWKNVVMFHKIVKSVYTQIYVNMIWDDI